MFDIVMLINYFINALKSINNLKEDVCQSISEMLENPGNLLK